MRLFSKTQVKTSRTLDVYVYGNNSADLESKALDIAAGYFGPDVQTEVVPGYSASMVTSRVENPFAATIVVREVL